MKIKKRLAALIAGVTMVLGLAVTTQAAYISKQNSDSSQKKLIYQIQPGANDVQVGYEFKNLSTKKVTKGVTRYSTNSIVLSPAWYETILTGYNNQNKKTQVTRTYVARSPKVKLKRNGQQVKVTWTKVKGSTGYMVYMNTNSGSFRRVKTVSAKKARQYVRTQNLGTTYGYYVIAYKKIGGRTYYSAKPTKYSSLKIYRVLV